MTPPDLQHFSASGLIASGYARLLACVTDVAPGRRWPWAITEPAAPEAGSAER